MLKPFLLFLCILLAGCSQSGNSRSAQNAISAQGMLAAIKTLSSDEFEGRGPATRGEERTVKYITDQFKALGLAPGNPDGSYAQAVPLVGIRSKTELSLTGNGKPLALKPREEVVALSRRFEPQVEVKDSEIVFVGYGIVAPEYGWDDYKGVDVKGKTIVMLVNDPPMPDPARPSPARRADVQGQGDDVLRPLDLQVRDRERRRGRGGDHHPRDRAGRLSVRGAGCGLGARELRHQVARTRT